MNPEYYGEVLKKFDTTPIKNICIGCAMYAVHGKKCWFYHPNKTECSQKNEVAESGK